MKIKREVWAEFGDGSVAAYGVKDDELQALLTQLCGVGMPCAIWVDGRLWTKHGQSEPDAPSGQTLSGFAAFGARHRPQPAD